jgi:hypothetical protein
MPPNEKTEPIPLHKQNANDHLNHASRRIIFWPTVLQIKKSKLRKQAIHQIKHAIGKINQADGSGIVLYKLYN